MKSHPTTWCTFLSITVHASLASKKSYLVNLKVMTLSYAATSAGQDAQGAK